MKTYNEYVMVTDWRKVDADDFYLTDEEWAKDDPEAVKHAKELQSKGELFYGYIVAAVNYVIYRQMDASQIFIDEDGEKVMSCEGEIIGNKHQEQFEYSC